MLTLEEVMMALIGVLLVAFVCVCVLCIREINKWEKSGGYLPWED